MASNGGECDIGKEQGLRGNDIEERQEHNQSSSPTRLPVQGKVVVVGKKTGEEEIRQGEV